jgi:hypothetical protein
MDGISALLKGTLENPPILFPSCEVLTRELADCNSEEGTQAILVL